MLLDGILFAITVILINDYSISVRHECWANLHGNVMAHTWVLALWSIHSFTPRWPDHNYTIDNFQYSWPPAQRLVAKRKNCQSSLTVTHYRRVYFQRRSEGHTATNSFMIILLKTHNKDRSSRRFATYSLHMLLSGQHGTLYCQLPSYLQRILLYLQLTQWLLLGHHGTHPSKSLLVASYLLVESCSTFSLHILILGKHGTFKCPATFEESCSTYSFHCGCSQDIMGQKYIRHTVRSAQVCTTPIEFGLWIGLCSRNVIHPSQILAWLYFTHLAPCFWQGSK